MEPTNLTAPPSSVSKPPTSALREPELVKGYLLRASEVTTHASLALIIVAMIDLPPLRFYL